MGKSEDTRYFVTRMKGNSATTPLNMKLSVRPNNLNVFMHHRARGIKQLHRQMTKIKVKFLILFPPDPKALFYLNSALSSQHYCWYAALDSLS